jgi:hypothetical protein
VSDAQTQAYDHDDGRLKIACPSISSLDENAL